MSNIKPNYLEGLFPEHKNRTLHILVSLLAFVLVAGSIIVYQIKKVNNNFENSKQENITNKELIGFAKVIKQNNISKNQLSTTTLKVVSKNVENKKSGKPMSKAQLENIANLLNK